MTSQAGRIINAMSAKCVAMKDVLDRPDLSSVSLIVNLDRNGNPQVTFRFESRQGRGD